MLKNRFAGSSLAKMKRFKDAGIVMNGQIVLCKGWNDKEELERTIHDLSAFLPQLQSVSIVPVGITKFRDKLTPLEPFSSDEAKEVLETVHKWQHIFLKHYGTRFIYASDEWYINLVEYFTRIWYLDFRHSIFSHRFQYRMKVREHIHRTFRAYSLHRIYGQQGAPLPF